MRSMFESATLKLTAWYLLILMSISLVFSVIIYQVSFTELEARLDAFESRIEASPQLYGFADGSISLPELRSRQLHQSEINLFFALFYMNIAILILGGIGSYGLARWSLKPIERSHEEQARFTSDASHELRTPLAVMKSELEVALRDTKFSKADMKQLLESNLEEVNRLSSLSQALLELSRHEHTAMKMKPIVLSEVISKVVNIHSLDNSRIVFTPPKTKTKVNANHASLTELLMIVLDNALRYSPTQTPIKLWIEETRSHISFHVQNEGKGISGDDLPHVFERFYRGDKSRTHEAGSGYGLGLSLAKKIADVHGAIIHIASDPGKITTVKIVFKKV